MELALLREVAEGRHAEWERAEAKWDFIEGMPTDKPCARLDLATRTNSGSLLLWTSGEAELEWGSSRLEGQRHFDLVEPSEVLACVDELERRVGLR